MDTSRSKKSAGGVVDAVKSNDSVLSHLPYSKKYTFVRETVLQLMKELTSDHAKDLVQVINDELRLDCVIIERR